MNKFLQIFLGIGIFLLCILLTANLYIDYQILKRMPPTISEVRKATPEARKELLLKQPMIRADVNEPLRVFIENEPLRVEVDNEPLEVEINE